MKRISAVLVMVVVAAVAAACGGGQPSSSQRDRSRRRRAAAPAATQNVDITLKSEPDPPKTGENTFEVMVMAGGAAGHGRGVAVELFMAAMPEMKMPEMRNSVPLKHEGDGRYRGTRQRDDGRELGRDGQRHTRRPGPRQQEVPGHREVEADLRSAWRPDRWCRDT